jgi:hypothetical protein
MAGPPACHHRAIVRRFRFLVLLAGIVVLGACKLDVAVDLTVNPDGTGELVVVATVDADVVTQVPGLAGSLQLDDAVAAGWVVEGPVATDGGGLSVTLRHPFASVAEATVLLSALSPPLAETVLSQEGTDDAITTRLSGSMTLPASWDGYADAELLQASGGSPFGAQLDAAGVTPADAVSMRFRLTAPGSDDAIERTAVGDGSAVGLDATSVLEAGGGSSWGRPVAMVALVLLAAWLLAGGYLAARVVAARRRRRRRYY